MTTNNAQGSSQQIMLHLLKSLVSYMIHVCIQGDFVILWIAALVKIHF